MPYHCTTCGEEHDDLPDIGADKPDQILGVPEEEYGDEIRLTGDLCVSGDDYFIRGVLYIPIHGQEQPFGFGVWISQKRENFETYVANFDTPKIGPFFGCSAPTSGITPSARWA